MNSTIFFDKIKYTEKEFPLEEQLEKYVKDSYKVFLGKNTLYFDLKNKIDSQSLGASIPDGILFDFTDRINPEFYLVEIELSKHDFYKHIFPQITKFFAFFKNPTSRNNFIEKIFNYIKANIELEHQFIELLGKKEIYKTIKDALENSQNILLIIDGEKPELSEVMNTYTDTWDKMVRVEVLKRYSNGKDEIVTLTPDFEELGIDEIIGESKEKNIEKYSEEYHTEGIDGIVKSIYENIKNLALKIDPEIKVNPQHYYVSLRKKKNFAYIKLRKKKVVIVIMLPLEVGRQTLKYHKVTQLSEGIQRFYNGECFNVVIENDKNLQEVGNIIEKAYLAQL